MSRLNSYRRKITKYHATPRFIRTIIFKFAVCNAIVRAKWIPEFLTEFIFKSKIKKMKMNSNRSQEVPQILANLWILGFSLRLIRRYSCCRQRRCKLWNNFFSVSIYPPVSNCKQPQNWGSSSSLKSYQNFARINDVIFQKIMLFNRYLCMCLSGWCTSGYICSVV
jgi:hypothetical protein